MPVYNKKFIFYSKDFLIGEHLRKKGQYQNLKSLNIKDKETKEV